MQALLEKPYSFSFFQLVHLLQRFAGGVRIGSQGPASKENVRIRPAVSLAFPAADVQSVDIQKSPLDDTRRYRVTTSFMGLYSSDSPLPTYYAEDLFWREDNQEAVRDFVDIFHHRALSLLYRTWEKYRYPVQFRHKGKDELSGRIFSLAGLGSNSLIESTGLPSVRLLRYTGLITQKPHSADALTGIVRDYFSLPHVAIEQCVERWIPIDPSQQNRLGTRNCALNRDLSLGDLARDCGSKFRVVIGPLNLSDFLRFTPASRDYAALVNLVRYFATDRLDFDIKVTLKAEEAPPLRLSSETPQRLGWTSCLANPKRDPAVVYRQPKTQSPQTTFPWPEPVSQGPENQENRG
jgi:type VI secretion system protein ImpH